MLVKIDNYKFNNEYKNILFYDFEGLFLFFFVYKEYYLCFFFENLIKQIHYFTYYNISYVKLFFYKLDLYKAINSLFFCELFVDGIYYRVKYYKKYNILGFILGFNHYILFKLPITIRASVHMKKRRFFIYGFDLNLLGNLANEIVNLKFPTLFKSKGLKIVTTNYRKKLILKKTK